MTCGSCVPGRVSRSVAGAGVGVVEVARRGRVGAAGAVVLAVAGVDQRQLVVGRGPRRRDIGSVAARPVDRHRCRWPTRAGSPAWRGWDAGRR